MHLDQLVEDVSVYDHLIVLFKCYCIVLIETRSNSVAVQGTMSPSDVFGSLVSDTEEFLEDLNHRHSISSNISSPRSSHFCSPPVNFRLPSAPLKQGNHVRNISMVLYLQKNLSIYSIYFKGGP